KGREDGEDFFGPVPFNPAGHAGMTGNCTICHHYTPAGQPHPECRSCHEPHLHREDITKPSLKAAYHRQCIGCHREWSGENACGSCHLPKENGRGHALTAPAEPHYMAHKHPVVAKPDVEVYTTEHEP